MFVRFPAFIIIHNPFIYTSYFSAILIIWKGSGVIGFAEAIAGGAKV
jgi:hypothetical protein